MYPSRIALFISLFPLLLSAQGTLQLMADLRPGSGSSQPKGLIAFQDRLYFFADTSGYGSQNLFVSDGTSPGTQQVSAFLPTSGWRLRGSPLVLGDQLLFWMYRYTTQTSVRSILCKYGGPGSAVEMVLTTNVLPDATVIFKKKIWFSAGNSLNYVDLQYSTAHLFYVRPSVNPITNLTATDDYLYCFAEYWPNYHVGYLNLYRSNGHVGSWEPVINVGEVSSSTSGSTGIIPTMAYENGHLRWHTVSVLSYIGTTYGGGYASASGLPTFTGGVINASAVTDSILFVYTSYSSPQGAFTKHLYASTGNAASPYQDVLPDSLSVVAGQLTDQPNPLLWATPQRVFFRGYTPYAKRQLYVSDGTVLGTHMVHYLPPGNAYGDIDNFLGNSDGLYFTALDTAGYAVWHTDGTNAGTQRVAYLPSGFDHVPQESAAIAGGKLFMAIYTSATGTELWATPLLSASVLASADDVLVLPTFSLTPNPVGSGGVWVVLPTGNTMPAQLYLADPFGRIVRKMDWTGNTDRVEMATAGLAPGLYVVTLIREGSSCSQKLVVSR